MSEEASKKVFLGAVGGWCGKQPYIGSNFRQTSVDVFWFALLVQQAVLQPAARHRRESLWSSSIQTSVLIFLASTALRLVLPLSSLTPAWRPDASAAAAASLSLSVSLSLFWRVVNALINPM